MSTRVDAYIEKQPSPQKKILQEVRQIFREAIPGCEEEMAWGVVAFAGERFYLVSLKDHVHVGFSIAGMSPEEISLLEGSGKTMRHIRIDDPLEIDREKLVKLIRIVMDK